MRAYFSFPATIIILLTLIFISCRSTRRLNENQSLVTALKIDGIDKDFSEQAYSYVSLDIRPNSAFNLWIYNTFNKKGTKNLGEAPHLLDSTLVEISRTQIQKFLNTKGFLNATVTDSIAVEDKRAQIYYTADPGQAFSFRNLTFNIEDSTIAALYLNERGRFTKITPGARLDEDSIAYERDQIYFLMRKEGYYDFVRPFVRAKIDTNFNHSVADVELSILNPGDSTHQKYTLQSTYIRIQPSNGIVDTNFRPKPVIVDSQYYFFDYSHFFKPKKFTNYIFLSKDELYNIENVELTNQRLFELNVFKSVSVDFGKRKAEPNTLYGIIDMIPLKKKSNRLDGEYTFNSSITGFNVGLTYQNRNIFGGAELFEVKLRTGFQFDKNISGSLGDRLLSRDYQLGASLSFPRLITPFNIPAIGKNGVPHTKIASSYQIYQLRDSYKRKTLGTTLTYDWLEAKNKLHSFSPVNVQYSQGDISQALTDSLITQGNYYFVNTLRSQLVASSIYDYTYNLNRLNDFANFNYLNTNIEIGGNLASLVGNIINKRNAEGEKLVLGVPYYQFARIETDWRIYKYLGGEKQLVFRFNPGIGYAYGNTKILPFEKMFFAGGSSGIRAWQARTLGPGNYNRKYLGSEIIRRNFRNIDQLGDLKYEGNVEFRFKLLNDFFGSKVKGATFLDYGNTWSIRDNGFQDSQIQFDQLWNQIAVGTGVGLRFDVSFFVFRLDAGFKLKDPQFTGSDQWVSKYYFDKSARKAFQHEYETTNSPDKYTLTQIQFGIGMPF